MKIYVQMQEVELMYDIIYYIVIKSEFSSLYFSSFQWLSAVKFIYMCIIDKSSVTENQHIEQRVILKLFIELSWSTDNLIYSYKINICSAKEHDRWTFRILTLICTSRKIVLL